MDSSKSVDPFAPDDGWDDRFHGFDGSEGPSQRVQGDDVESVRRLLNGPLDPAQTAEPVAEGETQLEPVAEAQPEFATGGVVDDPGTVLSGESGPEQLVPVALVTDEPDAGAGEAVNAETGEVTQPGEPLPPLPESVHAEGAEPLPVAAEEPQSEQTPEAPEAVETPAPATKSEPEAPAKPDPVESVRQLLGDAEHTIEHIIDEAEHAINAGDTIPADDAAAELDKPDDPQEGTKPDAELPS